MVGSKVLVTGFTGLLGNVLCQMLVEKNFLVFGIARNPLAVAGVKIISFDLVEEKRTVSYIKKINPSIIFHTAALTNVDYCEEHSDEAYLVNVQATKNVAEACRQTGSLLVYISTDFIFDGKRGNYSEEDQPKPLNVYGKTKLKGEKIVLSSGVPSLVARTSIYGWNILPKQNFAEAIISQLQAEQEFTPFGDQYFTPIYTRTLSNLLLDLAKRKKQGVYHLVCDQRLSKFEFAQKVGEIFGLDQSLLKPQKAGKIEFKAKRPKDVSLSNLKVKRELEIKKIDLISDLKLMQQEKGVYGKT